MMRNNIKKVYVFDFDKTIIDTGEPEENKLIWKQKTGVDWAYKGFWGRRESLDLNVFNFPLIKSVIYEYDKIKDDKTSYKILLTGRILPLKEQVINVLNHHNLLFDEYLLNTGGDTLHFKLKELERIINEFNHTEEIQLFDDREKHLNDFKLFVNKKNADGNVTPLIIFNQVLGDSIIKHF